MVDPLLFGHLADARRARPRRFRLFNAHLEEHLSENDVKSRLADLLYGDLARNTVFRYALRCPWALTIRSKIPGRISGNFHRQMVQSFSSVEGNNCSSGTFQWLLNLNHKYRSKQNTVKVAQNSFLHLDLIGCYSHSLSLNATIMVSKSCPTIGEHVVVLFIT